jgi:hypothetical protein
VWWVQIDGQTYSNDKYLFQGVAIRPWFGVQRARARFVCGFVVLSMLRTLLCVFVTRGVRKILELPQLIEEIVKKIQMKRYDGCVG